MATFSTASMFGDASFSDVVVRYGERELPAHKLVLSNNSAYFKAELAKDKSVGSIRLDDRGCPDATEAVLRHLYGLKYGNSEQRLSDWRFQLKVAAAAKQYNLTTLETITLSRFEELTEVKMPMARVTEILRALPDYYYLDTLVRKRDALIVKAYMHELLELPEFMNRLCEEPGTNLPDLLQVPEFAQHFGRQPGQTMAYLVQFGKAFQDLAARTTGYHVVYPVHLVEATEQATRKPKLKQAVVQQTVDIKGDRTESPSKKRKIEAEVKTDAMVKVKVERM
ncbi:Kelch-like protein 40 [Elasticomyces elasticus]|nr:Kelch-like protein 40 [Elasticomyces elasticus]